MRRTAWAILAGIGTTAVAVTAYGPRELRYLVQELLAGVVPPAWPNERFSWLLDLGIIFLIVCPGIVVAILIARRRPYPKGHCRRCGYDLTGNESGICPECGTPR